PGTRADARAGSLYRARRTPPRPATGPRIRGHVLEAPRVPGIILDFPRHVIVTKSDVIPLSRGQILELDRRSAVLHGPALLAQARKLAVHQQHVEGRSPLRAQRRTVRLRKR